MSIWGTVRGGDGGGRDWSLILLSAVKVYTGCQEWRLTPGTFWRSHSPEES